MKSSTSPSRDAPGGRQTFRRGWLRRRSTLIVGVAATALVGAAAVAQAHVVTGHTTHRTKVVVVKQTTTWWTTPKQMHNGSWSYGTWQGHTILVPARLAPPRGSRLATILVGRGALTFTCTNGRFTNETPLINLFTPRNQVTGLHFPSGNAIAPLVWGSSKDGSRADMAPVRQVASRRTAPAVLLRAVRTTGGPRTTFGGISSIIRIPITGGLPPQTCRVQGQHVTRQLLTFYLVFRGGTTVTTTTAPTTTTTTITKTGKHW
jgi:hypothetical protein